MKFDQIFDKIIERFEKMGFNKHEVLIVIVSLMFVVGSGLHFYTVWMINHPPKKKLTIEDILHKTAGMCNKESIDGSATLQTKETEK